MFRFHYARIDQRLNQKAFASRIGVPTTTYSLMEQGRGRRQRDQRDGDWATVFEND